MAALQNAVSGNYSVYDAVPVAKVTARYSHLPYAACAESRERGRDAVGCVLLDKRTGLFPEVPDGIGAFVAGLYRQDGGIAVHELWRCTFFDLTPNSGIGQTRLLITV